MNVEVLREENRILRRLLSENMKELAAQPAELQKLRNEAFLHLAGKAALDPELLRILLIRPIHSHALLEELKISPPRWSRLSGLN